MLKIPRVILASYIKLCLIHIICLPLLKVYSSDLLLKESVYIIISLSMDLFCGI